jgi:hypothetical protein
MPPGFQPLSPSPPPTARSASSGRLPPNRRLNMDEIPPAPNATAPVPTCRYNPLTAMVYTAEGRAEANDIFLKCCRLAAHHSNRFQLVDIRKGDLIPADSNIFVREPCRLFRTEILEPLQKNSLSAAFHTPFQSFMEHLLRRARIDLVSICNPNFFSGEFLQSLLSVKSWMVSPHLQPTQIPARTFHVYRLIPSLCHYSGMNTLLLPNEGMSLMDAKHVGVLTYHLFAMLDLTESFEDTKFRQSIFGQRLQAWSDLLDNPMIHGIRQKSPDKPPISGSSHFNPCAWFFKPGLKICTTIRRKVLSRLVTTLTRATSFWIVPRRHPCQTNQIL